MAALAADINVSSVGQPLKLPFSANAADIFYQGAVIWTDTAGGVQATIAAGDRVAGISPTQQTVAAAADLVELYVSGYFWTPLGAAITAADEGELLIMTAAGPTDNIADAVSAGDTKVAEILTDNDAAIGRIKRVTATQMLIELGSFTGSLFVEVGATLAGYWD